MKRILSGAAALALLAGSAVQAQPPAEVHEHAGAHVGGGQRPSGGPAVSARPEGGFDRQRGPNGGRPMQAPQAAPSMGGASAAPTFDAGRRGGYGGGQRFGAQAGVQAGAQVAPAQPSGPQSGARFGGYDGRRGYDGGRFNGQRFGAQGQAGAQAAPSQAAPSQTTGRDRGYDAQRSNGQGFNGQRFGGGQRFDGQRFSGGGRSGSARSFSYRGRSFGAFRVAPYRYPRGYGYRRYSLHARLPLVFLSSSFFLNDYADFYLAPPPSYEYRWVRYGPDALLVDTYTGEVVDAAYGVFDDGDGYDGGGRYASPYDDRDVDGYPPPPPGGPY